MLANIIACLKQTSTNAGIVPLSFNKSSLTIHAYYYRLAIRDLKVKNNKLYIRSNIYVPDNKKL